MSETVAFLLPGMERVQVRRDLAYKPGEGAPWLLDLYLPGDYQEGDTPRPAVIFIHGEAQFNTPTDMKESGQYTSWGRLVAACGLIGVTFTHRASQEFTHLQDPAEDIDDVVRYLRTQVREVDVERLGIWACSAGGSYGLRAAYRVHTSSVRCVVAYYAMVNPMVYREMLPATIDEAILREFSPEAYLNEYAETLAPLLLVRAGRDTGMNRAIDPFVQRAIAQNLPLELINYPEGQHAFDVREDTPRMRAIIQRTLDFLTLHLA